MEHRKVLVIGSGAIKIAEAAEFDYSGSQALKALKEEGIETVLVNPNVATVQTSHIMADRIYMVPLVPEYIERVIEKERPDGIFLGFGGQSALNAGVDLHSKGVLEKYNVKVLGTRLEGIEKALSRAEFKKAMEKIGLETPPSVNATDIEEAIKIAKTLEYPVILRVSFNLGGRGSIIAWNEDELVKGLDKAFAQSKTKEVLIEKHLRGWKEIEYEVVRDSLGNCAVTACIENLDPMGVHTGESVVVTPAQTLDNREYQEMRSAAIKVAECINLVGECNVQFALDPKSYRFYVIETNPRMSRSSALASKATGYPLAYVSAKLALGYKLHEVKNSVSKVTTAFFEPSLDYITIKMPRWDLEKFELASASIGTEMKSIGEVMSIGRNFEEAFQKSIRMLDIGEPGLTCGSVYNSGMKRNELETALKEKRPYWFLYAAKWFKEGYPLEELFEILHVDRFFLGKIKNIVEAYEAYMKEDDPGMGKYTAMKKLGFSDHQLGNRGRHTEPFLKQIDTLAGEWPARTNYLYATYNGSADDKKSAENGNRLLVIGAGCFRIGVSVEFDWSAISLVESARKHFDSIALMNCNPETVSTDWDSASELYFEELSSESILSIYRKMRFSRIAIFASGQIGNNIAEELENGGAKLFGSSAKSIGGAEDRDRFATIVDRLGIKQPRWTSAKSISEIKRFIDEVGFPVLIRPSYILSGAAMKVANNAEEFERFMERAAVVSRRYPVVISKYFDSSVEAEMDCASDGRNVIGVSMQHIEEAGVHSGDSTIITPFFHEKGVKKKMNDAALSLAREMEIRGPFNIQFLIKDGDPYIIELNLRASRSMPFSSKSVGINMVDYGVKGITGRFDWSEFYEPDHKSYAAKSAQFSWSQIKGAYPLLGPEMRSTGEAASMGTSLNDALLKSWLSINPNRIPEKAILLYGSPGRKDVEDCARSLSDFDLLTLKGAEASNVEVKSAEEAIEAMREGEVGMLVTQDDMRSTDYSVRRTAADLNIPMVLNFRLAQALAAAFKDRHISVKELREYW